MTEQDNHITPDQNTPDNNTPHQTTSHNNAPHYITKSPQHNTKNLPLQVLGSETSALPDGLGSFLEIVGDDGEMIRWVPLTEAERAEAKERYGNWQDDVLTPVEALAAPVGGYVSYVNGDGGEERISLMEEEERAIQEWWKDEKGEI